MKKFDIVITHVNFNDINWQNEYKKYFKFFNYNRHRAEINLKYLFRSINDNLDFVNNIYLVVSSETQVYDWINRDKVKIVLHEDIIPKEFLPTFNSCCIEMFLHKIPGLSEEFIYFNDDFFITNKKTNNCYLTNNRSRFGYTESCSKANLNITKSQYINDLSMIQKLTNKTYDKYTTRLQSLHIPILYFKSCNEFVYNNLKDEIHKRITKNRQPINNSQYLFMDYMILSGKWCADIECYKHYKYIKIFNQKDFGTLKNALFDDSITDVCVNHVDEKFIPQVNELFEQKFPNKSIYEL